IHLNIHYFPTRRSSDLRLENTRKMKRGTFDKLWTGGRWLDFEESANKERHSSLGYQPRQGVTIVYMSLDEAAQFVSDLFFQWLRSEEHTSELQSLAYLV